MECCTVAEVGSVGRDQNSLLSAKAQVLCKGILGGATEEEPHLHVPAALLPLHKSWMGARREKMWEGVYLLLPPLCRLPSSKEIHRGHGTQRQSDLVDTRRGCAVQPGEKGLDLPDHGGCKGGTEQVCGPWARR